MSEQLTMDFASNATINQRDNDLEPDDKNSDYEILDHQLATLFVELNNQGETLDHIQSDTHKIQNSVITQATLDISKHTREGKIAISIDDSIANVLLQSKMAGHGDAYKPLIIDQGYLYLRRYWVYQDLLANRLTQRMQSQNADIDDEDWLEERLNHYFPPQTESIDWQRKAAEQALKQSFLIVSGGPGTGKTTTITRLLALLIEQFLERKIKSLNKEQGTVVNTFSIALAAPTGKAAIRMLDAIHDAQSTLNLSQDVLQYMPEEASTIHKLLGYQQDNVNFKHNHENPLKADVVLVDEASMIDIALMSKLIEAVDENSKLVLIGDRDQLSSVETGSVFADICEGLNNSTHLLTLKKNWRFAKDSGIGQCANAANKGDSQTVLGLLHDDAHPDCRLVLPETLHDDDLLKPWKRYFECLNDQNTELTEIFEAFSQYRILCALRRGMHGSVQMNRRLEYVLMQQGQIRLPQTNSQQTGRSAFYHGRPVMIAQNDYTKGLFNGDTGIALQRDGRLSVYFPDTLSAEGSLSADGSLSANHANEKFTAFAPIRLPAHETTWAMTIHKSQGSEFNHVTMILPQEEMPLLTKQLIYTGITRAKQQVDIVAKEAVLAAGIHSDVVKATRITDMFNTVAK